MEKGNTKQEMSVKPSITLRKAAASDSDFIEDLYNEICDDLEAHRNFPGWLKGVYPVREDAEKGFKEGALY